MREFYITADDGLELSVAEFEKEIGTPIDNYLN